MYFVSLGLSEAKGIYDNQSEIINVQYTYLESGGGMNKVSNYIRTTPTNAKAVRLIYYLEFLKRSIHTRIKNTYPNATRVPPPTWQQWIISQTNVKLYRFEKNCTKKYQVNSLSYWPVYLKIWPESVILLSFGVLFTENTLDDPWMSRNSLKSSPHDLKLLPMMYVLEKISWYLPIRNNH